MYGYEDQFSNVPAGKQREIEHSTNLEDETFAKAFEQAQTDSAYENELGSLDFASQIHGQQAAVEQSKMEHLNESQGEQLREARMQPEGIAPEKMQYRIGSDTILDESSRQSQQHSNADDADELARTAGNLLDNVKGDTSKKFQESNFLSLMRQLRDREVTVDGDRIVDVSQHSNMLCNALQGAITKIHITDSHPRRTCEHKLTDAP